MAMSEDDLQKLRAHYVKHAGSGSATCPICGGVSWSAEGPVTPIQYHPTGGVSLGGPTTPMVLLICNTCYFVRHFAWIPIETGATNG